MYVTIHDITVSPKRRVVGNERATEVRTVRDTAIVVFAHGGTVSYNTNEFVVHATDRPQ